MLCLYTEDFRNLHEMHEILCGDNLVGSVDPLLCGPQYNSHCQQDLQNSYQYMPNVKDMDAFCDFVEYVLKRGGRGHISSSTVQFAS